MNRLDKIEARTNAATEGPWEWDGESNEPWPAGDNSLRSVSGAKDDLVLYAWGYDAYGIEAARDADAEFIAHARTDVPWLLEQVKLRDKALEAVLEMHELAQPITAAFGTQEGGDYCRTCVEDWPCPTVETIRRHLGDDL